MSLTVVRDNAIDLGALAQEESKLESALRDAEYGRSVWLDDDEPAEKLTPERRAEVEKRLAEIKAILKPHRDHARREEFPRVAAKVGFPSRSIADATAPDLDTSGSYYRALEAALTEQAHRRRALNMIVLAGHAGTGKTTAVTWYGLQAHVGGGYPPKFLTAAKFFRMSRYDGERDPYLKASELVLDDLGAEYLDAKDNVVVDFDELVNGFYAECRLLILTTNIRFVTPEQRAKHKAPSTEVTFQDRYGVRVVDRLRQCGRWVLDTSASKRRAP